MKLLKFTALSLILVSAVSCGKKDKKKTSPKPTPTLAPTPAPQVLDDRLDRTKYPTYTPPHISWEQHNQYNPVPHTSYCSRYNTYPLYYSYAVQVSYGYTYSYDPYTGMYCYYHLGYWYVVAHPEYGCHYTPPENPDWNPESPSCGNDQTALSFDSRWQEVGFKPNGADSDCKVSRSKNACYSNCDGQSEKPEDYINQNDFHSWAGCHSQSSGYRYQLLRKQNPALSTSSYGMTAILWMGSDIRLRMKGLPAEQDYYLSISAEYSGEDHDQKNNEILEIQAGGETILVDDLKKSGSSGWKKCYIPRKLCLKNGDKISFKAPHGSVHLDAYRITTHKPGGLEACPLL